MDAVQKKIIKLWYVLDSLSLYIHSAY